MSNTITPIRIQHPITLDPREVSREIWRRYTNEFRYLVNDSQQHTTYAFLDDGTSIPISGPRHQVQHRTLTGTRPAGAAERIGPTMQARTRCACGERWIYHPAKSVCWLCSGCGRVA